MAKINYTTGFDIDSETRKAFDRILKGDFMDGSVFGPKAYYDSRQQNKLRKPNEAVVSICDEMWIPIKTIYVEVRQ